MGSAKERYEKASKLMESFERFDHKWLRPWAKRLGGWLAHWIEKKRAELQFVTRRNVKAAHSRMLEERKLKGEDVSEDLTLKRIHERSRDEAVLRLRRYRPRKRRHIKA